MWVDDEPVLVDPCSIPTVDETGLLGGTADPFEKSTFHLGSPDRDIALDEGGLLSDTPITISIGGLTN